MGRGGRLVITLSLLCIQLLGQNDLGLGKAYLAEGQYELAENHLKKAFKKQASQVSFTFLLKCYKLQSEWSKAEKLCKKYEAKSDNELLIKVDRAHVYRLWKKEKKAEQLDKEIISSLPQYANQIIPIGQKYVQLKSYPQAIKVYKKGRRLLDGDYPFCFELSEVYAAQGQQEEMVNEILKVLQYGRSYSESVKNAISTQLFSDPGDKKKQLFKRGLLSLSQKHADETIYSELLLWMFLEEKDYAGAFTFSRSLDKRNNENGRRLMDLAKLARKEGDYRVARKCYNYVVKERSDSYYQQIARKELVNILQEKLDNSPSPDQQDIQELLFAYESTLKEMGKNIFTLELQIGYAKALAFYAGESKKGIELMEHAIELSGLGALPRAKCKIALGDIYVLEGDVWEASLLYGQVNQEFKHDVVGHEAKLKAAKAYYYTGNFEWAKTQLDVLKARTSKLIANDAMLLSVLISDNLGMDTSTVALSFFAKADLYHYQGMNDSALFVLNQLIYSFPDHLSLLDDAYYLQGKIYAKQKQWEKAIVSFKKVMQQQDLLADEALMQLAKIHELGLVNLAKAKYYYGLILTDYPGSIFSVQARAKYRNIPVEEYSPEKL